MPSFLAYIKEITRRELTQDDKFFLQGVYYFELKIPPEAVAGAMTLGISSFLFPLALNPESINLEEPFAVEVTQTQDGGVYVEENGVIVRRMTIRGHTGFKPRKLRGQPGGLWAVPKEKRSFNRQLPEVVMDSISGQRHFQYLQDAVFRIYGDLKRDPETSKDTRLFFLNQKDDEHWEVIPQHFRLERNAGKPVLYSYSIDLLIVGPATSEGEDFSEDAGLLGSLKNVLRTVNNAFLLLKGAVQDLTNLVAEIKSYVAAIGTIMTNALSIIDAVGDFIDGVTSLVQLPAKIVQGVIDQVDGSLQGLEDSIDRLAATGEVYEDIESRSTESPVPSAVTKALQDIALANALLLINPSIFETPLQQKIREMKDRQSLARSASAEALAEAADLSSPSSFNEVTARGSGLMPGDAFRAQVEITDAGSEVPVYTGLQQAIVEQGDSLMTIASRMMGDSQKWVELAATNNLKAPFVSGQAASDIQEATDEEAMPGALGVGKTLLVPNYQRPPEARPLLPVLGVPSDREIEEKLLGSDLCLYRLPGEEARYDVLVDAALGSADAKVVRGMENLKQAITLRIVTEKGSDAMYRQVGLEPIVGTRWIALDKELVKFRVMKTVAADPRIIGIRKASLAGMVEGMPDDAVEVTVDADVMGLTQAASVQLKI